MASNSICATCLRAIRQQPRSRLQTILPLHPVFLPAQIQTTSRTLTTTSFRLNDNQSSRPSPRRRDNSSSLENIASTLRTSLPGATEPYIAYSSTEYLFNECKRQCDYTIPSALATPPAPAPKTEAGEDLGEGTGWWLEPKSKGGLGLQTTFNTWAQVLFLHMWLLTVRLRCFPAKYVQNWHQHLVDHFFSAAEDRMATWHGMSARGVRNKYLKDLWAQWRGVMISYDEGLIKGDAVMAAAIWRNIFKASPDVDVSDMALITAYVMRELQMLGKLSDAAISEGQVTFGDPREMTKQIEGRQSPLMRRPATAEELEAVKQAGRSASAEK